MAQSYDRCSKLALALVTSEVVGLIPDQTHVIERATLTDSIGFLLHYITNRPILSIELIMS
jgi:hypothetical protein